MIKKVNPLKRIVPVSMFTEVEKSVIENRIPYRLCDIVLNGSTIHCIEFQEDVFDVLDDLEAYCLFESSTKPTAEERGFSTRVSAVAFQAIRELGYVNGKSLLEVGKSLKVIARVVALAVVVGLGNIDMVMARRLLPLVKSI